MADNMKGQRHDRTALILYGTETGNSQDVAEQLGCVFERLHFVTSVSEMDEVEINVLLKFTVVIFAISTTGQGEFPRNSRKFWKGLLRKRLPPNCLGHVDFTTFGLGDSSYSKFNWTVRKLHKRLEQLGAKEVYPRGEGDEQHDEGLDGAFLPWKADFNKHLLERYPLPEGKVPIPESVPLPPKFLLEILRKEPNSGGVSSTAAEDQVPHPSTIPESEYQDSTSALPTSTLSSQLAVTNISLPNNRTTENNGPAKSSTTTNMRLPPPEELYPDPPPFIHQLKDAHPGLAVHVDKELPSMALLPILGSHAAELIRNKRVTPTDHWQDVRELAFLVDDRIDWQPGDVMTIYPKNFPDDVQALIDLQGWNDVADLPLVLQRTGTDIDSKESEVISCIPRALLGMVQSSIMARDGRVTLRDLLTNNLDITSIPKRSFLQSMSYFTDDDFHKERLQEFCNPTYTDEFFDYTTRPRRSITEVLSDFPSVQIPWNQAAWLFPIIRGRQFSITTGGNQYRYDDIPGYKKVELLVAIVKYKTVIKKIRQGVCSRYLSSLPIGSQIQVTFDRPSEKFYNMASREPHRPLLLIAAGTGIAPCRALIWERATIHYYDKKLPLGHHFLIYGGRNKNADYFFEKEWANHKLLTEPLTAFSRDQKNKIYVQDKIRDYAEYISKMITQHNAIVYVCGSSGAMPKSVKQALVDALTEWTGVGDGTERDLDAIREGAIQMIDDMVKKGIYIEETW